MSSSSFDYARAWSETIKPAYDALPEDVHALLALTADAARDLHQSADLGMPWPTDPAFAHQLRARFEAIDASTLARAARIVHNLGHWRPSDSTPIGPLDSAPGCAWKFSHYADQVLRGALGLAETGDRSVHGWSFKVHEGAIRLCYSSSHMWSWEEIAPADADGYAEALTLRQAATRTTSAIPSRQVHKRDEAAYTYIEQLRTNRGARWPNIWRPLVDLDAYMTDPATHGTPAQRVVSLEKERAALERRTTRAVENAAREAIAYRWLLDHGITTGNVIYYAHRDMFTFGWRAKVGPEFEAQILAVVAEFPFEYEIKCADGRVLSGRE